MNTYKVKELKSGNCFWKYFWNGFAPNHQKFCPHCCSKITNEEYFEIFGVFTYGCDNCKEKKDW